MDMCTELVLGVKTATPNLSRNGGNSGIHLWEIKDETHLARTVLGLIGSETAYSLGSFMGCSCGFYFGDWSRESLENEHDKRVANIEELRDLISEYRQIITGILTLDKWKIHTIEEFPRHQLDLNMMSGDQVEFGLNDDAFYTLAPE